MNIMVRQTQKSAETVIENFKNHLSCKFIKKYFQNYFTFTFRHVTTDEVKKAILDSKNNTPAVTEIPVKIFKNCGCAFDTLKSCINQYQLKLPISLTV